MVLYPRYVVRERGPLRIAHIGRILTESNDGADELRLALFDQVVEYLKGMLWMIGVISDFRDSLMKAREIESAQRTICPSRKRKNYGLPALDNESRWSRQG